MAQDVQIVAAFTGKWKPFSNFHLKPVKYKAPSGRLWVFPSNENGFQAIKSLNEDDWKPFALGYFELDGTYVKMEQQPYSSFEAKQQGKKLLCREDWDEIRVQKMLDFNRQKYEYPELRELLLSTGDALIQEGNYWHDVFWGVCNGQCWKKMEHKLGAPIGRNFLGLILMQVREEIKAEKK